MQVSVVVCTYDPALYADCCDAADSVLEQTHGDVELVVVVDGDQDYCERISATYGDDDRVTIACNDENLGLSRSRNVGIEHATGDVVAFMDDDAVADDRWIEELVEVYESRDALAVGGKMTPIWVAGTVAFLPREFYWLIGVTHRWFAEPGEEVRNTFGSNISFRRDVLDALGGFDTEIGRKGDRHLQSEETLLCARMRTDCGRGVVYNPDAEVGHKVFRHRTSRRWLVNRAFWQGYSKRVMERLVTETGSDERNFVRNLIGRSLPERLVGLVRAPSVGAVDELAMLCVLTAAVGLGYGYGALRY